VILTGKTDLKKRSLKRVGVTIVKRAVARKIERKMGKGVSTIAQL
jgi:hypothetical protein